uniref:Uncharacterized protein n=1 Tax=Romanomermis culicivorax TaxID=13658 RepID=A0A915IM24_ROMCU
MAKKIDLRHMEKSHDRSSRVVEECAEKCIFRRFKCLEIETERQTIENKLFSDSSDDKSLLAAQLILDNAN